MHPTRLREVRAPAIPDGEIIDASFSVVRERKVWRRVKTALLAAAGAAVVGFLIPPLWIVAQHLAPALAVAH